MLRIPICGFMVLILAGCPLDRSPTCIQTVTIADKCTANEANGFDVDCPVTIIESSSLGTTTFVDLAVVARFLPSVCTPALESVELSSDSDPAFSVQVVEDEVSPEEGILTTFLVVDFSPAVEGSVVAGSADFRFVGEDDSSGVLESVVISAPFEGRTVEEEP